MLPRDIAISSCGISVYVNSSGVSRYVLFVGFGGLPLKNGAQGKSTCGTLRAIQTAYAVIRVGIMIGLSVESTIFMTYPARITLGRLDLEINSRKPIEQTEYGAQRT